MKKGWGYEKDNGKEKRDTIQSHLVLLFLPRVDERVDVPRVVGLERVEHDDSGVLALVGNAVLFIVVNCDRHDVIHSEWLQSYFW